MALKKRMREWLLTAALGLGGGGYFFYEASTATDAQLGPDYRGLPASSVRRRVRWQGYALSALGVLSLAVAAAIHRRGEPPAGAPPGPEA